MKIGVLTSSRADFGIYQPLLSELAKIERVDLHILAFGMHVMSEYGNTIDQIKTADYGKVYSGVGLLMDDSPKGIAKSYANVVSYFSEFWESNSFDLLIVLGDRFEMSAAVQSTIPFELKIAHIHGGEETLGATDNIYRHQITLASTIHFASAEPFVNKIRSLKNEDESIFNVGSLSIDGLKSLDLPKWADVCAQFDIPNEKFVLITVHPETIGLENNKRYINEFIKAITGIIAKYQIVITMPNADASGKLYRDNFLELKHQNNTRVSIVETFGKLNYFSAMRNAQFLLGNTSSGIIEAASFDKYVVNVGDRQKGRLRSDNILDVAFLSTDILNAIHEIEKDPIFKGKNCYQGNNTAKTIVENILNEKL